MPRITSCCSSSCRPIGVSMIPGASEFTRLPSVPGGRRRAPTHDDPALGQPVGVSGVGDLCVILIEEPGRQGIVDQGVQGRVGERCDLVGGERGEADGCSAGNDQRLEGLEDPLGRDEVDIEDAPGVCHGRRDPGDVDKRPERAERGGHAPPCADGGRIRDAQESPTVPSISGATRSTAIRCCARPLSASTQLRPIPRAAPVTTATVMLPPHGDSRFIVGDSRAYRGHRRPTYR